MSGYGNVQIGEIEDLGNFFQRHLLPVQSFAQVLWLLVAVAVGLLTIFTLNLISGETHSVHYWLIGAAAATAGSLPAFIGSLQARFVVRASRASESTTMKDFLVNRAIAMGYTPVASAGPDVVLHVKRWWASWRESTLRIMECNHGIEVRGPKYAIRILHRRTSEGLGR